LNLCVFFVFCTFEILGSYFLHFVFVIFLVRIFFVLCISEKLHLYFLCVKIENNHKKCKINTENTLCIFVFFVFFPLLPKLHFVFV